MEKNIKLQSTKTNNTVNIPKIFLDNLKWSEKEELTIVLKNNELIIRKRKV